MADLTANAKRLAQRCLRTDGLYPSEYLMAGYVVTSVAIKQVPGYWVFSAMLKRPITEKLEFQANFNNLSNRYHIDLPHPSHLIPGAGATALIGGEFQVQMNEELKLQFESQTGVSLNRLNSKGLRKC